MYDPADIVLRRTRTDVLEATNHIKTYRSTHCITADKRARDVLFWPGRLKTNAFVYACMSSTYRQFHRERL